ncbi:hypothetical protein AGR8A_pTi10088 [Agrobacterium fabrum str. J-07]|nr:hypothetical protein AGR8A_pTi10088 [Agrobacterium fabrum str. J-07]
MTAVNDSKSLIFNDSFGRIFGCYFSLIDR